MALRDDNSGLIDLDALMKEAAARAAAEPPPAVRGKRRGAMRLAIGAVLAGVALAGAYELRSPRSMFVKTEPMPVTFSARVPDRPAVAVATVKPKPAVEAPPAPAAAAPTSPAVPGRASARGASSKRTANRPSPATSPAPASSTAPAEAELEASGASQADAAVPAAPQAEIARESTPPPSPVDLRDAMRTAVGADRRESTTAETPSP